LSLAEPRRRRAAPWTRTLLPGPERLAKLVDGLGEGSAPGEQLVTLFRRFLEHLAAVALTLAVTQRFPDEACFITTDLLDVTSYLTGRQFTLTVGLVTRGIMMAWTSRSKLFQNLWRRHPARRLVGTARNFANVATVSW
jgi:hypothetical protein